MAQSKIQPNILPPLESVIQKMIDAGESEENIASVIRHYNVPPVPPTKLEGQPTDFWGGVKQSITSGEAANASLQGGLGWLKGAVLDLPSSIAGGLKSIGNAVMHPIDTISNMPSDISNMASGMWNTAKQAGSNPDAFGEMMGQLGGQPLLTESLIKGTPPALSATGKLAGKSMSTVGSELAKTRTIGGLATVPTRLAGRGIARVGELLKDKFSPVPEELGPHFNTSGLPNNVQNPDFFSMPEMNEPPQIPRTDTGSGMPSSVTPPNSYTRPPQPNPIQTPTNQFGSGYPVNVGSPSGFSMPPGRPEINPLITKSMETPLHPLDALTNTLGLDSSALDSLGENNNITSNFQKGQGFDTPQEALGSPETGATSGMPNDLEKLITQLEDRGGQKFDHPSPLPEPPIERNPVEISTSKSKLKSGDTIVRTGPDDIEDMKVWHNIGRNKYKPEFSNTLDKIKFLAGQTAPSKNLPQYLKFIMDQTGLDETMAKTSAREFRLHAKEIMEQHKPGAIKIPSIGGK